MAGHYGKSRDPLCHSIDRLYVVGVDEIPEAPQSQGETVDTVYQSAADPNDIALEAFTSPDGAAAEPSAAFAAYDPNEAESEDQTPEAKTATRRKVSTNGTKPKVVSGSERASVKMEWRQPAPTSRSDLFEPGLVRTSVELPIRTYAYYEAARNSPDLAFEGTLSEFVDSCIDAFFRSIGYSGVQLVRAAVPMEVA